MTLDEELAYSEAVEQYEAHFGYPPDEDMLNQDEDPTAQVLHATATNKPLFSYRWSDIKDLT